LQKLEFNTATGTALYPYSFSVNYEFVDTEMSGDLLRFDENNEEDKKMEGEFALCSRTFRNRRGEFRSPRNVFLHGRGGAKNLSCLYRFEANAGEQVRIIFASIFVPSPFLMLPRERKKTIFKREEQKIAKLKND
jgi:hypothetical protein